MYARGERKCVFTSEPGGGNWKHKRPNLQSSLVLLGPLHSGFLTVLTAPHGGAEDSGILSVVERVAISIHWMVEKCEVPMEGEKGSGRAGLGLALVHPS